MRSFHSLPSLAVLALALSAPVFGQSSQSSSRGSPSSSGGGQDIGSQTMSACKSDVGQFCKDVTPGQGRIAACLRAHEDKLSPGCQTAWQNFRTQMRNTIVKAHRACGSDVQKFCPDAVGGKELSSCLDQHSSQLSDSCKNFRVSMRDQWGRSQAGTAGGNTWSGGSSSNQPKS